jgi:hypothetical protein
MRDQLAHRYFDTSHAIVAQTVGADLVELLAATGRCWQYWTPRTDPRLGASSFGRSAPAATLVGVPGERGARYTKGHPSGRCAARRAALPEARPRVAGVGARPSAGSQQGRGLRRRAPVRLQQPPPQSRVSGRRGRSARPESGESPDEGSATRVNRPRAAAVRGGAAVPCWLDRRAAARAAAQLRALHPTSVTLRPFSAVASIRLVTGHGTSRTPVLLTSDLPTEDSPVEDTPSTGSIRPLPVEDRPSTEVRKTLAGGYGVSGPADDACRRGGDGCAVPSYLRSDMRGSRASPASRYVCREGNIRTCRIEDVAGAE